MTAADENDFRKWAVAELNVRPFEIHSRVFMKNGKSRKGEILAMWKNNQGRLDELKNFLKAIL